MLNWVNGSWASLDLVEGNSNVLDILWVIRPLLLSTLSLVILFYIVQVRGKLDLDVLSNIVEQGR